MDKWGNYDNLGDEIKNIVRGALNNRDFNQLNRDIGNTVNSAMDEVRRKTSGNRRHDRRWNSQNSEQYGHSNTDNANYTDDRSRHNRTRTDNADFNAQFNGQASSAYNPYMPVAYFSPVGKTAGILLTVFGIMGTIAFSIAIPVMVLLGFLLAEYSIFYSLAIGFTPLLCTSVIMWISGKRSRERIKRFKKYIGQLNGHNYCMIKDLSAVTGTSTKYIVKDLNKMIAKGMFPQGHLDDEKTGFILTNECYEQYLKLKEGQKLRAAEEKAAQEKQAQEKQQEAANPDKKDGLDSEIRNAINEGRQYVQEIRNANIAIPGEEVSEKLDKLEEVTGKIFDYVEVHPEQFSEIRKFMGYYLPTTLKLLDAYKELDGQAVKGENITTAKQEIEKTLDTINLAFENLLDSLFKDAAMDISTDISVLETMFAQEGLTENKLNSR